MRYVNETTAKIALEGLQPNSKYMYVMNPAGKVGTFKTFPAEGAEQDVLLAFGSCAKIDSEAYPEIAARSPDVFIHMGDLHYGDIDTDDESLFDAAFDTTVGADLMRELAENVPLAYVWDGTLRDASHACTRTHTHIHPHTHSHVTKKPPTTTHIHRPRLWAQ